MNEQIERILQHPATIPSVVGAVAFGIGTGVGYILGVKKATKIAEDIIADEFPKYDGLTSYDPEDDVVSDIRPEPVIIDAEEFMRRKENEALKFSADPQHPTPEEEIEVEPEVVTHSVFAGDDDDWNYEAEVATRTENAPYILHKDEFYLEESGYSQFSLVYYEGDNILADEQDVPVYNHEKITGPLLFGHGSGDPNVLYVRNDKSKAEYEIIRNTSLYSLEVQGLSIEDNQRAKDLRHSDSPRKFRSD